MYSMYILYSKKFDKFYIGSTSNLKNRINKHNIGGSKYTKPYKPWKLVYQERYYTRSEAVKRERFLKSMKDKDIIKKIVNNRIPV